MTLNTAKTMNAQQARDVLAGDCFGLVACLMAVHDQLVMKLVDVVPERGEKLWVRFTTWRDAQPKQGDADPFTKWVGATIMEAMFK